MVEQGNNGGIEFQITRDDVGRGIRARNIFNDSNAFVEWVFEEMTEDGQTFLRNIITPEWIGEFFPKVTNSLVFEEGLGSAYEVISPDLRKYPASEQNIIFAARGVNNIMNFHDELGMKNDKPEWYTLYGLGQGLKSENAYPFYEWMEARQAYLRTEDYQSDFAAGSLLIYGTFRNGALYQAGTKMFLED